MTPPINSVSDDELIAQLRRLVDDQEGGDAVVLVQRQLFNRVVGRLAARRAANTPVDGVVVDPATILAARDALLADNLNEAWHQLYTMADPTFTEMQPWRNLEHKAALSASPTLPSQVVELDRKAVVKAIMLEVQGNDFGTKLPNGDFRTSNTQIDLLETVCEKAADRVLALVQSCLTSPAAEPLTVDDVERIIVETEPASQSDHGDKIWTRRMAVALAARLSHPAPSASREVTVTDEMVEMAADALERQFVAGGPDVSWDKAARAALLAALPEREVE